MYQLSIVPQARLIRIHVSGFSDLAETTQLIEATREAAAKLNATGKGFKILADLREGHVLQSESTEMTEQLQHWLIDIGVRKVAHVTTSALFKMQLSRMAGDPRFRFFTSEEEALDWLEQP
jgi:hypothetical protein